MAFLDLIITHWKEKWADGRKMFEMLKMQKGVEVGEFRVILVQDGDDDSLDIRRITRAYSFVERVITIPQSGVSAARNAGLDASDAEWVMFCDFDDCVYSIDSMYRILQSLREAGDRADLVWSDLWIEMRKKDGGFAKVLKKWNTVFIHGKCYRRSFLVENGIRFDERLSYSEDAMFNALVAMEILPSRIAKMPETVYMWCYREESLSNYTGGDSRRARSLFLKRMTLPEEYDRRGMGYEAKTAAARALMDYYWEDEGGGKPEDMSQKEWMAMPLAILAGWPGCIRDITPGDRKELYRITREEAESKGQIREGMRSMQEWMTWIGALKK